MKRLNINYLYLEITRRCTLRCAHCMRGDNQGIDISEEVIDNSLKDIVHIHELDLGGGEPLLAPVAIETIINKINEYGIRVDKISFTTNGTVLTPRVIELIGKLQRIAPLNVRLSHDKFHLLEIYIKRIADKVENNNAILTAMLGYDPKDKDFVMDDGSIHKVGRAKELTQDDLDAINKWIEPSYYHFTSPCPDRLDVIKIYDWEKEVLHVCGSVVISATGFLSQMDREYDEEDKGLIFGINVKSNSLLEALIQYENEYNHYIEEKNANNGSIRKI